MNRCAPRGIARRRGGYLAVGGIVGVQQRGVDDVVHGVVLAEVGPEVDLGARHHRRRMDRANVHAPTAPSAFLTYAGRPAGEVPRLLLDLRSGHAPSGASGQACDVQPGTPSLVRRNLAPSAPEHRAEHAPHRRIQISSARTELHGRDLLSTEAAARGRRGRQRPCRGPDPFGCPGRHALHGVSSSGAVLGSGHDAMEPTRSLFRRRRCRLTVVEAGTSIAYRPVKGIGNGYR
jgi:hypothetical protein